MCKDDNSKVQADTTVMTMLHHAVTTLIYMFDSLTWIFPNQPERFHFSFSLYTDTDVMLVFSRVAI